MGWFVKTCITAWNQLLSTTANVQTNWTNQQNLNLKVDHHTGGKSFIRCPIYRKGNRFLSLEHWLLLIILLCKSDIKEVHANMIYPVFKKMIIYNETWKNDIAGMYFPETISVVCLHHNNRTTIRSTNFFKSPTAQKFNSFSPLSHSSKVIALWTDEYLLQPPLPTASLRPQSAWQQFVIPNLTYLHIL